jgi:hypothetical protein
MAQRIGKPIRQGAIEDYTNPCRGPAKLDSDAPYGVGAPPLTNIELEDIEAPYGAGAPPLGPEAEMLESNPELKRFKAKR